jgi:hypothetical protein
MWRSAEGFGRIKIINNRGCCSSNTFMKYCRLFATDYELWKLKIIFAEIYRN